MLTCSLVTKPTEVTKPVYRNFLINWVLPAITERWSGSSETLIFIQQDNARPYINIGDNGFAPAGRSEGFSIRLRCQPPNSPGMNVLDLGYFATIQALQHQMPCSNIDEKIEIVVKFFTDLSLQAFMLETMKTRGSNRYEAPYVQKKPI